MVMKLSKWMTKSKTVGLIVSLSFLMPLTGTLLKADEVSWEENAPPTQVGLSEVVKKVSTADYRVLENALQVYQAKKMIDVARGNLLPKLNFWKIVTAVVNPMMLIGMIEDIAPFLVPANWFRLKEAKHLYVAQNLSYQALWANEVMNAKALYFRVLQDQSLKDGIEKNIEAFNRLYQIVRNRELLGEGKPEQTGGSLDIQVKLLELEEDKRSMQVLIREEKNSLSYIMGYPAQINLQLTPVSFPEWETLRPLQYLDFESKMLGASPELKEYIEFVKVADLIKKEVLFSFLGASSMSRGVAGGVFDSLPIPDGLGFGSLPSMKIVKSQKEILNIQKMGVEETIKRQLLLVIDTYNLDLENYRSLNQRVMLTEQILKQLFERLSLGGHVESSDLLDASRNQVQALSGLVALKYRFLMNSDRLIRLVFEGDYAKPPIELPHANTLLITDALL